LFEEDAKHFHQTCKTACDKHNLSFIQNIKSNAMPIFGMHIEMKLVELADYSLIIAKQPKHENGRLV
jgi:hypothetical protein